MDSLYEALSADDAIVLILHEMASIQAGGAEAAGEAGRVPGAVQGRDQLVQYGQSTGSAAGLGQSPAVSTAPSDIRLLTPGTLLSVYTDPPASRE